MHTLSKVALLAVVAGLTAVPSAMAAPPMSQQQMAAFCRTHPQDPQCNLSGGQGQGTGHNQGHQPGTNPNPPAGSPPPPTPGAGPNNGPSLSFNFSSGDRSQFHNRFRGLNFGTFGVPGFSISIGTTVPHSYGLKPGAAHHLQVLSAVPWLSVLRRPAWRLRHRQPAQLPRRRGPLRRTTFNFGSAGDRGAVSICRRPTTPTSAG